MKIYQDDWIFMLIKVFQPVALVSRYAKIVSEYDQKIPQSQNADKPMASRERATQQARDTTGKTNKAEQPALSSRLEWT